MVCVLSHSSLVRFNFLYRFATLFLLPLLSSWPVSGMSSRLKVFPFPELDRSDVRRALTTPVAYEYVETEILPWDDEHQKPPTVLSTTREAFGCDEHVERLLDLSGDTMSTFEAGLGAYSRDPSKTKDFFHGMFVFLCLVAAAFRFSALFASLAAAQLNHHVQSLISRLSVLFESSSDPALGSSRLKTGFCFAWSIVNDFQALVQSSPRFAFSTRSTHATEHPSRHFLKN